MSYDIFCYKSKLGKPDEDEADSVIEADNDKWKKKDGDASSKLAIVKALIIFNPQLKAFDFDNEEISKLTLATLEEAENKFDHFELNPAENEIAIQLTVFDNHVFITVPYWYQNNQAQEVNNLIKDYIKVIWKTAGYFVYDPQSGQTFDPSQNSFDGLNQYLSVSEYVSEITNSQNPSLENKKPWWKFW